MTARCYIGAGQGDESAKTYPSGCYEEGRADSPPRLYVRCRGKLHVAQFAPGLREDPHPTLDLIVAGQVPVDLEVLNNHLALREELLVLLGLRDLGERVGLAADNGHPVRAIRGEESLRRRALAVCGLFAQERQELGEDLQALGLPAAHRRPPRGD